MSSENESSESDYSEEDVPKEKIKGRQGRSFKSREKAKLTKKEQKNIIYERARCLDCKCECFIEDRQSGDLICAECGLVAATGGLMFEENDLPRGKFSKPYHRVVHFRQRLAQLIGKDPRIRKKMFDKIVAELNKEDRDSYERVGKKTISRILTKLNLPRRYAANWIQIRRRTNLQPLPPRFQYDDELWKRMNLRYFCVAKAFEETLSRKNQSNEIYSTMKGLIRKNIVNVNYTFLQLLRLEHEDYLKELGKFFPQLCSKEQPQKNNRRWKILMEYCKKSFPKFTCIKTDSQYTFNWEFNPLTQQEIKNHCSFFD